MVYAMSVLFAMSVGDYTIAAAFALAGAASVYLVRRTPTARTVAMGAILGIAIWGVWVALPDITFIFAPVLLLGDLFSATNGATQPFWRSGRPTYSHFNPSMRREHADRGAGEFSPAEARRATDPDGSQRWRSARLRDSPGHSRRNRRTCGHRGGEPLPAHP